MAVNMSRHSRADAATGASSAIPSGDFEATAYCPGCAAFETVWFSNGQLMTTQKFTLLGDSLYHDCGTARPCRLYRPR